MLTIIHGENYGNSSKKERNLSKICKYDLHIQNTYLTKYQEGVSMYRVIR
jgi:hypothetical protein